MAENNAPAKEPQAGDLMEKLVALCKRRGFIFQSSTPARKRRRRCALPTQSKTRRFPFAPIRIKAFPKSVFIGVHPWLNLPA